MPSPELFPQPTLGDRTRNQEPDKGCTCCYPHLKHLLKKRKKKRKVLEMRLPPHFATQPVLSLHHMLQGPSIDFCDKISMAVKDCKGNNQKARVRGRGAKLSSQALQHTQTTHPSWEGL